MGDHRDRVALRALAVRHVVEQPRDSRLSAARIEPQIPQVTGPGVTGDRHQWNDRGERRRLDVDIDGV